jgi:hypothetical protein
MTRNADVQEALETILPIYLKEGEVEEIAARELFIVSMEHDDFTSFPTAMEVGRSPSQNQEFGEYSVEKAGNDFRTLWRIERSPSQV